MAKAVYENRAAGNVANLTNLTREKSESDFSRTKTEKYVETAPFIELDIDSIKPNKDNFYTVNDIEGLKISILHTGLQEPLIVLPPVNGIYTLLSGERRYTALKSLVAGGNDKFRKVYCKIIDPDDLKVNLTYEEKVRWLITTTNSEQRDKTNQDILNEIKVIRNTYKKLKESGEAVPSVLRPFIAKSLGMSETQVQRFTSIEKNLLYEFFEMFCDDKLNISVADSICKLQNEVQKDFFDSVKNEPEITQPMLDAFLVSKKNKETKPNASNFKFSKEVTAQTRKSLKSINSIISNNIAVPPQTAEIAVEKLQNAINEFLAVFE